jgi:dihydrolipoamide dehydrogenase
LKERSKLSQSYDVGIIGAGPGGYVAAIRAAQLGLRVALVEKRERLGGTCLNIGCIPSKTLLDSSEAYWKAKNEYADLGVLTGEVRFDLETMLSRKDTVVAGLTEGLSALMKKNGVTVFIGDGTLEAPGKIRVAPTGAGDEVDLEVGAAILATGSEPAELPFLPFDGKRVVSSTDALSFDRVPKRLLVVGAGAIGLELGSVWARLGAKVAVVEIMETILPGWDLQVARTLKRSLGTQGFEFHLSTKVTGLEMKKASVVLKAVNKSGEDLDLTAEKVLVAVGRRPAHSQELQSLGIELDGLKVKVDARFQTSVPGVYAIGDLIDGPMLAHKAEEDGIACVELIAGRAGHVDYHKVPGVVYTWPEAASVGKTEEQLKQSKIPYKKGSFPFRANGRALASGDTEGFVKILVDKDTDRILGAHILGPHASALIAEIVAVMEFDGSAEDIGRTVHAHPTLPEAVREAALAAGEGAIHST